MTIAERFGASIEVAGPDPKTEGFFFKKRDAVDHDAFVTGLLGLVGTSGRLVLHHQSGFAIVRLSHGRAAALGRTLPWVDTVGGIRFRSGAVRSDRRCSRRVKKRPHSQLDYSHR